MRLTVHLPSVPPHHRLVALLTVCLALLAGTGAARAQCNVEADGERVQQLIDRAGEVVAASDVAEARRMLSAARERLREAQRLARERKRDRACAQLSAARALAEKALQLAMESDQLATRLEQDLARLEQLMQDIAGIVNECRAVEAERMLEGARRQLAKAWSEYRSRRFRSSYAFCRTAENQARRARLFCTVDSIEPQRLEDELERTDTLLEETTARLSEGDAQERLEPARILQRQAWEHFHSERFVAAYTLTRRSRDLARGAVGRIAREVAPREIETLVRNTRDLVRTLGERAEDQGAEDARRLLDQVDRLLDRSEADLGADRLLKAMASARAASALAQDVAEMLEDAAR